MVYSVVGLGAALRLADAGRPAFMAYLLASFMTACQATVRPRVLPRAYSRCGKDRNNLP